MLAVGSSVSIHGSRSGSNTVLDFETRLQKMPRPWLSILMPVYNGENYLRCALGSIFEAGKQNPFEVIAVDDGSTDSSLSILEDFLRNNAAFHFVSIGPRARELGQSYKSRSSGCYGDHSLRSLHQDDLWLEDRLLTIREIASEWPTADLILQPTRFIDHRGRFCRSVEMSSSQR